ncbi:MAG: DUF1294 domain-containing protein [Clostridiales bacterium]|nr:DUF1294 domain-containing protein [Clostridiales bacterium]MCF8021797.1 DUF1294 domain-containing protein [Clostridiales bacterium]
MGYDKEKAKEGKMRIPERVLFLVSIFGGAVGVYLGMKWFRHKTLHLKFSVLLLFVIALHLTVAGYFILQPFIIYSFTKIQI